MLKKIAKSLVPYAVKKWIVGRKFAGKHPQEVFNQIYHEHHWNSDGESISGKGSELAETETIRRELPGLFEQYAVKTVLDVPCGDLNWMREVLDHSDVHYTGGDIVADLVEKNNAAYGSDRINFRHLNLIEDELPRVDLIFSRDVWIHFSYDFIQQSIANFKRSGSTYLLASTYPATPVNRDIVTGNSRTIDLRKPPFNFPEPLQLLHEQVPNPPNAMNASKSLGLWRVADLPSQ